MMSNASAKNLRAIEIHDVASARIVGATQMLQKLVFAEIAQDRSVRPKMHTPVQHQPVPANTLSSVLAASPSDRYAFATAAGPQRDPFDCQLTSLWNVVTTDRRHARSISSGVRVTEDAMACGDTWDWPTTSAPAPSRLAATTTLTILT